MLDDYFLGKKWIWIALGIVLLLWAYQPVWQNGFVGYDDKDYIFENPQIQQGFCWSNIVWAFTTTYAANWHPVTWISHAIDIQLFGLNPRGHHLVNLLFHGLNIFLLFALFKKMTGQIGPSALIAALFGLHPLNVESVAWVAERKSVLSMFFALLTIWAYVSYSKKKSWKNYLAAFSFFLLGLLAKPMVVMLPVILLLLDFWPLKRFASSTTQEISFDANKPHSQSTPENDRRRKKKKPSFGSAPVITGSASRMDLAKGMEKGPASGISDTSFKEFLPCLIPLLKEKIPFFFLAACSSIVTIYAQKSVGAVKSLAVFPLPVRLANASTAYLKYLIKAIWPEQLAVFYPYPKAGLPFWQVLLSVSSLGLITFLVVRLAGKKPYWLVGWLWYLVSLVPMIGIIQAGDQAMADRYAYLPLIGIFIMLVQAGQEWTVSHQAWSPWWISAVLIVLMGMSGLTHYQAGIWQNDRTLFSHAMRCTENNFVAMNGIGKCLANEGKINEAREYFQQAFNLNPSYRPARENLAGAENNQGAYWGQQGKYDQAALYFQRAAQLRPDFAEFHLNLGLVWKIQGKRQEALEQFQQVIELQPGNIQALAEVGNLLMDQNREEEALWYFQRVVQLKPDAHAYYQIGILLQKLRKIQEAVLAFQQALKLNPQYEMAQSALRQIQNESP
jgi:tetratricopeptide (TPR) repeat protein